MTNESMHLAGALTKVLGLPEYWTGLRLEWLNGQDWPTLEVEKLVMPHVVVDGELQHAFGQYKLVHVSDVVAADALPAGEPKPYTDAVMLQMLRERGLPGVAMWAAALMRSNQQLADDLAQARRNLMGR